MKKKSGLGLLIILLIGAAQGCGDTSRAPRPGTRDFSGTRTSNDSNQMDEAPRASGEVAEQPLYNSHQPQRVETAEERNDQEAARVTPFIVTGEARSSLPAYEIPEPLRERLTTSHPELVAPRSRKFEVYNQHLHLRNADSSMTFTAVLRIPGKQDEAIELRCQFDKSASPWECADMYPTDVRIAEQRRLHATAKCTDAYACTRVGVELYVMIDGKTESQLFQNTKFWARKATSGDVDESDNGVKELIEPVPQRPGSAPAPKVYEKPTRGTPSTADTANAPENEAAPRSRIPIPTPAPRDEQPVVVAPPPELNDQELQQVMDDPNAAIELNPPIPMPAPARGNYSIPGIENLRPRMGNGVKAQAIGSHNGGRLDSGAKLPANGDGFLCRPRANRNYGTDLTIGLLTGAAEATQQKYPGSYPIMIANISKRGGGELCNDSGKCHKSHQTGLDVDIVFPSTKKADEMWSLCGRGGCSKSIAQEFDEARFWYFVKTLTCAEKKPVIAMFIDQGIKKHMCRWVKNQGEDLSSATSCAVRALQAMKHEDGHRDHVHVRFKCPGNRDCEEATVSLGRGTGC